MSSSDVENPYPLISLPTVPYLAFVNEDLAAYTSCEMALIHNVFIRSMNSIWRNAPLVKPEDEIAFAGYSLCCLTLIHDHHHGEETILFPFFETKLDMSHNVEQHESFHAGMDAFEQYMNQVFNKKDKYDGEKTRALLKAFADPLVQHLHEEIPTISEERLKLLDQEGLQKVSDEFEEHIKNLPGKLTVFPFVMTHHNFEEAPNWPGIPAPIKWFARNIAPFRHYSYWKFSPYTRAGVPQKYSP
ncbi:uncharacterized protein LACBIDRAFT_325344 [Laccaria bicolor S238N-H82]|uniref:Predicted protein n=1 Tax=Laccaria bicolor (strain S238N-H82 / ATCC MYA-4686) TaxID=486041 RepID=B0D4L9_LACBS|nr:uncharacterized protein LACBIDRAFT_325344 [Laccaria bicolor S238N-H82]EDR10585.1 predicted protein [Laccaria bicolor S238N-H82]|eukprot:XP_001879035.1 predicted protein [Laccaria bicolor S238N-H82]